MASIRICIFEADLVSSGLCALWRDYDASYANKFTCMDGKAERSRMHAGLRGRGERSV